ncbi:MAG TPA: acetate--CoA ligase family protein [Vicinamibacterales bacterium]|nr:acetate--CoA ligase family protein [Vicinamibacterales bacterium]
MNLDAITALIERARAAGRRALLETEGLELLDALGVARPRHRFIRGSAEAARLDGTGLPGDRLVLKVVSPEILHKSDVGGVAVVGNSRSDVATAIHDMETRLAGHQIDGFLLVEFVEHDAALGGELLAGLRWTDEFGAVVTIGAGGITTEFLARDLAHGRDAAIVSPRLPVEGLNRALEQVSAVALATRGFRGRAPRTSIAEITAVAERLMALARAAMPHGIAECEINPLAVTPAGLFALDVLVTLAPELRSPAPPRPIHKIARLLQPRNVAIIGVSEQLNPGRIILNNLLRDGFDRSRVAVVKPGVETIAGCACYPDVASLPERVDLFVLAVGAAQVPRILRDVVAHEKAESVIVIPGGLEEKSGSEAIVRGMREALIESRATDWQGPLINGGNCLGIRSRPGRYDTMFIPEHKMPPAGGPVSPVAIVAQSGAFAISRATRLGELNPRYVISVGNQMDVTIGDYLTFLADDASIELFAVYVEGFKPLDGLRFMEAARQIVATGRPVILYRAGRTVEGARATASHTASIAGDYRVTRALCEQAGVIVAESLEDFDDLVRTFALLRDREAAGTRLGALSNAGFESVAIADSLHGLSLATLSDAGRSRIAAALSRGRIDSLVDVHNPLDVTPMAGDAVYEEIVRALLEDGRVDVGVIGCVPMTGALQTLPAGQAHAENIQRAESVVARLARVRQEISKPWVAVVDAGDLYDPMAAALERARIPTFRTADRAVRMLSFFTRKARRLQAPAIDAHPAATRTLRG